MKNLLMCLVIGIAGMSVGSFAGDAKAEKAAVEAAKNFLALVDDGKYSESWDVSAILLKNAVTKEKWTEAIQSVRKLFGKNISRQVESTHYRISIPGAPDGKYVIIKFKSSFANKKSAIETITPMLDKDGQWRVAGYFIK